MKNIEEKIMSVWTQVKPHLSNKDADEILKLITIHGEYGIALENLCSVLEEKKSPIKTELFNEIIDLFRMMEFDDNVLSYYKDNLILIDQNHFNGMT